MADDNVMFTTQAVWGLLDQADARLTLRGARRQIRRTIRKNERRHVERGTMTSEQARRA